MLILWVFMFTLNIFFDNTVTQCVAIRFRLCWRHSDDLLVCFGTKPTQMAGGRDLPRDRKWRREGSSREDRESQLTEESRRDQSA